MQLTVHEREEAEAFNERISERVQAGFIPDLRRQQRCEYFYKSFWRDPKFTNLYVGEMYRNYSAFIAKHIGKKARVLDVGCGAGYFSLELAREGHDVVALDIADEAIAEAKNTLKDNPYTTGFGSLNYQVGTIYDINITEFDVVLFSGVLHHLDDLKEVIAKAKSLLKDNGIIISHEPCHEQWQDNDAAIVALLRTLLAATGHWYESLELSDLDSEEKLLSLMADIKDEYHHERDKSEQGQSPHDNTFSGEEILIHLKEQFNQLDYKASSSFIYRVLGGLRGGVEIEHKLAELLALFDRTLVQQKLLNPNYFYFVGRK